MAGKNAIINYNLCDFKNCNDGICRAIPECERKVIKQEGPFEPPYIDPGMCSGCSKCIHACPGGAIEKTRS